MDKRTKEKTNHVVKINSTDKRTKEKANDEVTINSTNKQMKEKTNDEGKKQTHKRLKRTLFIMTKHNMPIFGVSPFLSYKTTLKQQLNGDK